MTEQEFLNHYNKNDYEQLSMTTDILILSISEKDQENYRKTKEKSMSILLVKRKDHPYKDKWCLPGGFLNPKKETLEECAKRILKQETNIENVYLEQLYTFSSINRDPRCRVVSTSYVTLIDKNKIENKVKEDAIFFDIKNIKETKDTIKIELEKNNNNLSFTIKKEEKDIYNGTIIENQDIAFDHPLVIRAGIERIRNKVNYTDIAFHLMPEYFTLGELQQVYEVILNKKLLDPAFRRTISNKVIKTTKKTIGEGHRPSYLYQYKKKKKD